MKHKRPDVQTPRRKLKMRPKQSILKNVEMIGNVLKLKLRREWRIMLILC